MALPKVIRLAVVLLVICCALDKPGFRRSVSVFFEGLTAVKSPSIHVREKRETFTNFTDYEFQVVVSLSELEILQTVLNNLSFPIAINSTSEMSNIHATTVCSRNISGYQCVCKENFAWSYNSCITYGVCDAIVGDACGCINELPADGQFCQVNSSQTVTTQTPSSTTAPETSAILTTTSSPPPYETLIVMSTASSPTLYESQDIGIVLDLHIPFSDVPPDVLDLTRMAFENKTFPVALSQFVELIELNLTTACSPNATDGLKCECEDGYAWPCDMCNGNNSCKDVSSQTCACKYGLLSSEEFCQPITDIDLCPTSSPEITTVTNATTPEITTLENTTMPEITTVTIVTTPAIPTVTNATTPEITTVTNTTPEITTVTNATTPEIPTVTNATTPEITTVTNATTPEITAVTNAITPEMTTVTNATTPEITTVTNVTTPQITTVTSAATPEITTVTHATSTNRTMIFAATPEMTTNIPTVATTVASVTKGTFTLNMDFKESYNDESNPVYKDIYDTTKTKCQELVSKDCTVKSLTLRSGSTIADYTLSSPSGDEKQFDLAKDAMLNQLATKYPVDFVSVEQLTTSVSPETIIAGVPVTLTCGPPPTNLDSDLTVEWTRSGTLLDTVKPSQDRTSNYKIQKFLKIHDGVYVCKMKRNDGATFTQSLTLTSKPAPQITVNPVKGTVKCGGSVTVKCSVNTGYQVQFKGLNPPIPGLEISYTYTAPGGCNQREETITCQMTTNPQDFKIITLELIEDALCKANDVFSAGSVGFVAVASCEAGKVGNKTAVCKADGTYGEFQDNCVLEVIQNLLSESEALDVVTLPVFLEDLKGATINNSQTITNSPATISAMVKIFANIGQRANSLKITLSEDSTKNILESAGILTTDAAKGTWNTLNNDNRSESSENKNSSSSFLSAFEVITSLVVNKPLIIETQYILFTKTNFTNSFKDDLNSSVEIDIPEAEGSRQSVAVILFASMDNVLPARESVNTSSSVINGKVVLIQPESDINNISIAFDVLNETLGKPKCVFWDFNLVDGLGGWSDEGCSFVLNENGTVRCRCNHTTSFSILMSPDSPKDIVLDFITYIGVGLSMGSLVVCLIIEGIAWRKIRRHSTSYLRHVSIVNIAVSLLIADIWFIIGAAISNTKSAPACTAATFFIHFFYLALFFWMLASALLLLYRTLNVFEGGLSKLTMLIIGFSLGYGAPLIIATITIASTAPSNEYIRENVVCWLNWNQSKALLAFVVPALLIVVINLIILIVVLYKILNRRGGANAAQTEEKSVLYVIARSLAVLTPLFGLTWGLGVGVMVSPKNRAIHITFALFNSVQGFFILVFGTLLDKTVRSAMTISQGSSSLSRTTSTSARTFSSGVSKFFSKLKKPRRSTRGYHTSSDGSNT